MNWKSPRVETMWNTFVKTGQHGLSSLGCVQSLIIVGINKNKYK